MTENSYRFFQNKDCKYFPCHKGAEELNCLFCYCPLYALGSECGGNFTYTESGKKTCSDCLVPHSENGYDYILSKLVLLNEKMQNQEEKK